MNFLTNPTNRSERLIQIIDATVVQLRNEQLRVGQDERSGEVRDLKKVQKFGNTY